MENSGNRLQRWRQTIEKMYSNYIYNIPDIKSLDIGKLGKGGAITTDTCNGARKTRRLLIDNITLAIKKFSDDNIKIREVDCWNHFRNIWFGAMIKQLSSYLKKY